jgi:hypothetical protein
MRRTTLLLAALLSFAGCVKSAPTNDVGAVPASLRSYPKPYAAVWKTVLETVQYDFLIPIEVADKNRGYFSSELVKDYQPYRKTKYRLSGTIMYDGQATVVKLYKQLEVEEGNAWRTIPSDLSLESKVLEAVGKKLRVK